MVLYGVKVSAVAECQEFGVVTVVAELLGWWKKSLWSDLELQWACGWGRIISALMS